MALPLAFAVGIGQSAIGGFSNAFNKDRYKSDYHYATQDVKKQTKQLKEMMEQAKKSAAKPISSAQPLQLHLNQKTNSNNMNTNFFKTHAKKIGAALAVLVAVVVIFKMNKSNNSKLA